MEGEEDVEGVQVLHEQMPAKMYHQQVGDGAWATAVFALAFLLFWIIYKKH